MTRGMFNLKKPIYFACIRNFWVFTDQLDAD